VAIVGLEHGHAAGFLAGGASSVRLRFGMLSLSMSSIITFMNDRTKARKTCFCSRSTPLIVAHAMAR
jgi:hypothetical protein